MPRLTPVPRDQWSDEMFDATKKLFPKNARHPHPIPKNRPQAPGVMDTFALHPELASAFFEFNTHVLTATTLTAEQRHILILRVAARRRSAPLWAQHTFQARDLGMTDEFIGRIAFGPDAPALTNAEEALIRATDELIDDGSVSEETFAKLTAELEPKQVLDAIFTVGCYDTVSSFISTMDIGVDPDFEKYLAMSMED